MDMNRSRRVPEKVISAGMLMDEHLHVMLNPEVPLLWCFNPLSRSSSRQKPGEVLASQHPDRYSGDSVLRVLEHCGLARAIFDFVVRGSKEQWSGASVSQCAHSNGVPAHEFCVDNGRLLGLRHVVHYRVTSRISREIELRASASDT
jgi:hypothetical protein